MARGECGGLGGWQPALGEYESDLLSGRGEECPEGEGHREACRGPDNAAQFEMLIDGEAQFKVQK